MLPLIYALIIFGISIFAIFVAVYFAWYVLKQDTGTPKMMEISNHIKEGAEAFLKRQYKTIAILAAVTAVIIFGVYASVGKLDYAVHTSIAFVLGAFCSALAGIIGMYISVRANIRTAAAARKSASKAMRIALLGGAVSGIFVVALSLIGVAGVYYAFGADPLKTPFLMVGYAFGASFVASMIEEPKNIERALRWGVVNSAYNLTKVGAQEGVLTRQELLEKIK